MDYSIPVIPNDNDNNEYKDYYYDGNGGIVSSYEEVAWITVTGYDTVVNIQLN